MKLDKMRCPTCGRSVAFRLIRPDLDYGRRSPGIRKPVRHRRPEHLGVSTTQAWCPAGEP